MELKQKMFTRMPVFAQRIAFNTLKHRQALQMPTFKKSKIAPTVCFSFDTELSVGAVHTRTQWRRSEMMNGRRGFDKTFKLLNDLDVPATWAMCGHLLLEKCERSAAGQIHPEMSRIDAEWYPGDWYREDPGTDASHDDSWYAPDIAKKVMSAGHELACHSFSHPSFTHPTCTRNVAEAEIDASVSAAKKIGAELTSMVFPYNHVAYLDVLKERGFTSFRSPNNYVGSPWNEEKLVAIPAATPITDINGMRKKALKILDKGIENGGIIHFWTHPWEISGKLFESAFKPLAERVSKLAENGGVHVKTMKGIAKEFNASS